MADQGSYREALVLCQRALELKPDYADAWCNLGIVLRTLGRAEDALTCLETALSLDPGSARAIWSRSLCLLTLGRLAEGWECYERRWDAGAIGSWPHFPQPRWEGSDLSGKTILVWMEQGLADHILFAGMVPDLLRAGHAKLTYNDPHVPRLPRMRHHDVPEMNSMPLDADFLASQDCVLIATDHSAYDYDFIVKHSALVVDTRNATKNVREGRAKIRKA